MKIIRRATWIMGVAGVVFLAYGATCFADAEESSEALYRKGSDLLGTEQGDPNILEEARQVFEAILKQDPTSPFGYMGMSRYHRAKAYLAGPQYVQEPLQRVALPLALKAVELAPDFLEAHTVLAMTYLALQRIEEAEKEARRAIELPGYTAKAHYTLGEVLIQKGDPAGALRELEIALGEETNPMSRLSILQRMGQLSPPEKCNAPHFSSRS